jgi:hypothetical protein
MVNVDLWRVKQILSDEFSNPFNFRDLLDLIRQKSAKYRCSASNLLMKHPVVGSDGRHYERTHLEAWVNSGTSYRNCQMPEGKVMIAVPSLEDEIAHFSRSTLDLLDSALRQPLESALSLAAECLSVLSPHADLSYYLKVLEGVDSEGLLLLLRKLSDLAGRSLLSPLYASLVELRGFELVALAFARYLLLGEPTLELDLEFDSHLDSFIKLLDSTALDPVIAFAFEVSDLCNSVQLGRIRDSLKVKDLTLVNREKLDGIALREAKLKLLGNDEDIARHASFHDDQRLRPDNAALCDARLQVCLSTLQREGASPALVESLQLLRQLSSPPPRESIEELKSQLKTYKRELDRLAVFVEEASSNANRREVSSLAEEAKREAKSVRQWDLSQSSNLRSTCVYSYEGGTNLLHWTSLDSGSRYTSAVPGFTFKNNCSWSEVPGGTVFFTGGNPATPEVVSINPQTVQVSREAPMNGPRGYHSSLYHQGYIYVLGGYDGRETTSACERYDLAANRWEPIAPCLVGCSSSSAVVLEATQCLYVLGGFSASRSPTNLIQEFSLVTLSWRVREEQLPFNSYGVPVFKLREDSLYFVQSKILYNYRPGTGVIWEVRGLGTALQSWYACSRYSGQTVYCPNYRGAVSQLYLGALE